MKIVSTDGSSLSNPGPIGWAWADRDGAVGVGGYYIGTNQIAELTAVLDALRTFRDEKELLIESDSQYAINCASVWVHKWRHNGWRGSNRKEVANINLIKAISDEMLARGDNAKFKWVKGHSGDEYNEKVDSLANGAACKWKEGGEVGSMPEAALKDIHKNIEEKSNQEMLF
ncbi:MAG: ribonuclease HI [Bifidobacteriaceae bacterium]|jgi:ribonuclease HI|nr:ribonuclease HI [Bifidobacteriaceae bacterium]